MVEFHRPQMEDRQWVEPLLREGRAEAYLLAGKSGDGGIPHTSYEEQVRHWIPLEPTARASGT